MVAAEMRESAQELPSTSLLADWQTSPASIQHVHIRPPPMWLGRWAAHMTNIKMSQLLVRHL